MKKSEKELVLGNRLISLFINKSVKNEIPSRLVNLVKKEKKYFIELMDKYKIPQEVILNLKKGKGDLDGMYHTEGDKVTNSVVAIDIYTEPFEEMIKYKDKKESIDKELIDTLAHEIIHNKVKGERETQKRTKVFMKKI